MEIWLDTTDETAIAEADRMGILTGVTTNPAIIAQAKESLDVIIKKLLKAQKGYVAVQIRAQQTDAIVAQVNELHRISPRIIAKIPATKDGYQAINLLQVTGIKTMATAIFDPMQLFLAAKAGAHYAAPYLSRMETDGPGFLKVMKELTVQYGLNLKILVASIRWIDQINDCLRLGMHAVTIKESLLKELLSTHPKTQIQLEKFEDNWETIPKSTELSF